MALPSGAYAPRSPAASVLYQVVRDHYEAFRIEAAGLRDGEGLPRFVGRSSRRFCGVDGTRQASRGCGAPGAARSGSWPSRASRGPQRGSRVGVEGAQVLSSCGGRRMTERAAHLVDHVWPLAGQSLDDDGASTDPFRGCGAAAGRAGGRVGTGRPGSGRRAGRLPQRLGGAGGAPFWPPAPGRRPETPHARWEGFDLHAGVAVPGHRARLERVPSAIQRVFCSRTMGGLSG
jgi:hypothetical protein